MHGCNHTRVAMGSVLCPCFPRPQLCACTQSLNRLSFQIGGENAGQSAFCPEPQAELHLRRGGGPRGGGEGWHKALVVGSDSLWRRLLASRP